MRKVVLSLVSILILSGCQNTLTDRTMRMADDTIVTDRLDVDNPVSLAQANDNILIVGEKYIYVTDGKCIRTVMNKNSEIMNTYPEQFHLYGYADLQNEQSNQGMIRFLHFERTYLDKNGKEITTHYSDCGMQTEIYKKPDNVSLSYIYRFSTKHKGYMSINLARKEKAPTGKKVLAGAMLPVALAVDVATLGAAADFKVGYANTSRKDYSKTFPNPKMAHIPIYPTK